VRLLAVQAERRPNLLPVQAQLGRALAKVSLPKDERLGNRSDLNFEEGLQASHDGVLETLMFHGDLLFGLRRCLWLQELLQVDQKLLVQLLAYMHVLRSDLSE